MAEKDVHEQHQAEASHPATSAQRLETLSADASLRAIVARNAAASAHLLEHLAQDQDSQVRRAVAGNPNTPWSVLEHLAVVFPNEFLSNPVAPLQIIAHQEQINTDDTFWETLLREASIPSWWWDWLINHPILRASQAVHLHVQYAGETPSFAGTLQKEHEETVLTLTELLLMACAQGMPALPDHAHADQPAFPCEQVVEEHLWWLARQSNGEIRAAVAENAQTPVNMLRHLSQDKDLQIRKAVAENAQTPVDVLRHLAQDENNEVRYCVAKNKQAPMEVLQMLTRNAQTLAETLRTLAYDQDSWVRYYAAENAQTAVEALRMLALDQDSWVRYFVAENTQAPAETLRMLALDQDSWVRWYVADNTQTLAETLRTLALDEDSWVRQAVAENVQTPVDVLQMLVQNKHEDDEVRRAASGNVQMPIETLRTLAQDQDEGVRQVLAWNARTPGEVLQSLSQDTCANVRDAAHIVQRLLAEIGEASRQQGWWQDLRTLLWTLDKEYELTTGTTVEECINGVVKLGVSEPLREIILAALAVDWDASMIRSTFSEKARPKKYPHITTSFMPPIVLQKLAVSPSWEVRYLVALHERSPQHIRQRLSQDGNRYVRAMARAKVAQMGETAPKE
ncbi:MAG TPA: HEAT repeat domain-containing protein [Ktedonobacteraceae bacterium]|nr:HEAT repeat domain-containing protein [Ktedonobacteraceae bacterium]